MRTLVLLRLGFILFRFSVGKKAKAATPTRGSIRFFAKDMRLLLGGSHEGTIIIVTPRQFTQQSNFAAADASATSTRSRITFNFLCSSYCNHFEINYELNEEALLTYSTAANRTLRVVTHQPTTSLFRNWFPSFTFTYWGPNLYIF